MTGIAIIRTTFVSAPGFVIVVVAAKQDVGDGHAAITTLPNAIVVFALVPVVVVGAASDIIAVQAFTTILRTIPDTLLVTVFVNGFATVESIIRTICFGITVGEGGQDFIFGEDSSERLPI